MEISDNPFLDFLKAYKWHPVTFVSEVLNATPDPAQAKVMQAVALGSRRVSVRSGHGVGKSTLAAWLMIWYLLTRWPCKVVVTAPTSSQLYDALYAELKRWAGELPPNLKELIDVKAERVELKRSPAEAFISARTSRAETPEALQGIHSEHVMLIADEASGVPEPVFDAAAGSMSGEHAVTILLGNPVRSSGFFYDTHHRLKADWKTFQISCIDSPRVSKDYISDMAKRYGEDSNAFRIRVLGEFPRADDDTLIAMELLEMAKTREIEPIRNSRKVWGLDVARFGGDRSALAEREANSAVILKTWRNLDLMQLTGAVVHEYNSRPKDLQPVEILVDSIGLGAGVVDRLRELGLPARGINVSESPSVAGQCLNLRAELWSKAKAWFQARDCKIPDDETLISELAACRYKFSSNGKLQIESKEDTKRRGIPSPDVADAFVLTFASDAATALHGWSPAGGWNKPLKRNVRGIV